MFAFLHPACYNQGRTGPQSGAACRVQEGGTGIDKGTDPSRRLRPDDRRGSGCLRPEQRGGHGMFRL